MSKQYDALIVGSSFAGSLLAAVLARGGMRVAIVDRGTHPRFAIGESSTPTADSLLSVIAQKWNLPEIAPLARWGTWQAQHSELVAGKKRGFTYFQHAEGETWSDDDKHSNSYFVAASSNDEQSDTHWLRSDIDQFLCGLAVKCGVDYFPATEISSLDRDKNSWRAQLASVNNEALTSKATEAPSESFRVRTILDSTGSGQLLASHFGIESTTHLLRTRTASLFGHVRNLGAMEATGWSSGCDWSQMKNDPLFCCDDSAQHQLTSDGWIWMLRFIDGRTSVGIVRPVDCWEVDIGNLSPGAREAYWSSYTQRYPTIAKLFRQAKWVDPPGSLQWIGRINRRWSRASGEGWAMLPTTAGFIDPLHSTGIAHGLSGVYRLAELMLSEQENSQAWKKYGEQVVEEVDWIDQLVSPCYAAIPDFPLFVAATSLYFVATIAMERSCLVSKKLFEHGFLMSSHPQLSPLLGGLSRSIRDFRSSTARWPRDSQSSQSLVDEIRRAIEPWNDVGLMNPVNCNRLAHTAATKLS